ncbi:MAG: GGDEF domain-containing protein [Coriobacteriia bacterium]|nr:GGDEF domain-containing protein [Coriobacteriia bacterium]
MEVMLYAEVYLVCIVVLGIVTFFAVRGGSDSSSDRWFKAMLAMFLLNFVANFFFKLVNGGVFAEPAHHEFSYALKTIYHLSLCLGVFAWCGYADSEQGSGIFQRRKSLLILLIPLALPLLMILFNLYNHLVFEISDTGAYVRHILFQVEMGYLLFGSGILAVRLVLRTRAESDPNQRAHMYLTATFPLCIALAWLLSWMGEAFPVICVAITAEILCLYIGGARNEISMDKLTQVNNRQNLIGFMDYKERNNNGNVYLMMIDVDEFKQINDNYGHLEGDAALVAVAGILKRACGPFPRRPYIARFGGDEFVIIAEADGYDMQDLEDAINAELQKVNAARQTYQLMLSIGVVHWDKGLDHKQVINLADIEMYQVKRARKLEREAGRAAERTAEHEQLRSKDWNGR